MIALMMILGYLLAGLVTYRRVGYAIEHAITTTDDTERHKFQSLCGSCRCKHCGNEPGDHFRWRSITPGVCDNYERRFLVPHIRTVLALPPTLALWPGVIVWWATARLRAEFFGDKEISFWKAPPRIETDEERREREHNERQLEIERREREIAVREEELGIGTGV